MKKTEQKIVVWLCVVTIFLLMPFLRETKAEGAFVVEEETIIGGESETEKAETEAPENPHPPVKEESFTVQPPLQPGAVTVHPPMQKESSTTIQSPLQSEAESAQSESISQNSIAPEFNIPVKKTVPKRLKKQETEGQEPQTSELPGLNRVSENKEMTYPAAEEEHDTPWLLPVAGACLLGGIVRILWRLLIRYGKL